VTSKIAKKGKHMRRTLASSLVVFLALGNSAFGQKDDDCGLSGRPLLLW
jgi:hypothetical protein